MRVHAHFGGAVGDTPTRCSRYTWGRRFSSRTLGADVRDSLDGNLPWRSFYIARGGSTDPRASYKGVPPTSRHYIPHKLFQAALSVQLHVSSPLFPSQYFSTLFSEIRLQVPVPPSYFPILPTTTDAISTSTIGYQRPTSTFSSSSSQDQPGIFSAVSTCYVNSSPWCLMLPMLLTSALRAIIISDAQSHHRKSSANVNSQTTYS